jgi:hypothetical protein
MEHPPTPETELPYHAAQPRRVKVFDALKKTKSANGAARDAAQAYNRSDQPEQPFGMNIGIIIVLALVAFAFLYFLLFNV